MKESQIQSLFGKYLKENPPERTCVFELKICKGNSLLFDAVKPHQIVGLQQAHNGLYHKIADMTFGRAGMFGHTLKKPFDCVFIKEAIGYVAICFYKPRKKKEIYLIPINQFLKAKQNAGRKSLTEEFAGMYCERKITL